MIKTKNNWLKTELKKSWWVVFLGLICCFLYFGSVKEQSSRISSYQNKLSQLKMENKKLALENHDLQLRINSHSDPAWIEQVLMKELGVVPEGKLKVHFTPQK